MKTIIKYLAMAIAVAGVVLAPSAKAAIYVVPNSPSTDYTASANNLSEGEIATLLGITTAQLGTVQYAYAPNSTPSELSAPLINSYATTVNGTGRTYTIDVAYTGGPIIDPTYLVCKDGNLGTRIFDISGWNGTDTLEFGNPWPASGQDGKDITGLSHFQIYGECDGFTPVPEPSTIVAGTLLLLPFGVSVFRRIGRKA